MLAAIAHQKVHLQIPIKIYPHTSPLSINFILLTCFHTKGTPSKKETEQMLNKRMPNKTIRIFQQELSSLSWKWTTLTNVDWPNVMQKRKSICLLKLYSQLSILSNRLGHKEFLRFFVQLKLEVAPKNCPKQKFSPINPIKHIRPNNYE